MCKFTGPTKTTSLLKGRGAIRSLSTLEKWCIAGAVALIAFALTVGLIVITFIMAYGLTN